MFVRYGKQRTHKKRKEKKGKRQSNLIFNICVVWCPLIHVYMDAIDYLQCVCYFSRIKYGKCNLIVQTKLNKNGKWRPKTATIGAIQMGYNGEHLLYLCFVPLENWVNFINFEKVFSFWFGENQMKNRSENTHTHTITNTKSTNLSKTMSNSRTNARTASLCTLMQSKKQK